MVTFLTINVERGVLIESILPHSMMVDYDTSLDMDISVHIHMNTDFSTTSYHGILILSKLNLRWTSANNCISSSKENFTVFITKKLPINNYLMKYIDTAGAECRNKIFQQKEMPKDARQESHNKFDQTEPASSKQRNHNQLVDA